MLIIKYIGPETPYMNKGTLYQFHFYYSKSGTDTMCLYTFTSVKWSKAGTMCIIWERIWEKRATLPYNAFSTTAQNNQIRKGILK